MKSIKSQTFWGSIYAYLGVGVGVLTQGFLLPRYFDTKQIGLLTLYLAWTYLFAQVGSLGFNAAGTKFFPFFKRSEPYMQGYLNLGFRFLGLGSILCVLVYFLLQHLQLFANNAVDDAFFQTYVWSLITITISTLLFNLFDNYAKGLNQSVPGSLYMQLYQRLFVFLAALLFVFQWVTFQGFMWVWTIGFSLPMALMAYKAHQIQPLNLNSNPSFFDRETAKPFYRFAGFSVMSGMSTIMFQQLDKILVNNYLGLSLTGIYGTCMLFGSVMGMSYLMVNKASSPLVVDAIDRHDMTTLSKLYKSSSNYLFAFGALILLLTIFNLEDLFQLVKPEFKQGWGAIIIIGIAKMVDLVLGINGLILSNSKWYARDAFLVFSFVLVLMLCNHLLIPSYGLNGAAFASLIAIVYYNSCRSWMVYKLFHIHPFSRKTLQLFLITGMVGLLGYGLVFNVGIFLNIALKSLILGMVFLGLLHAFKVFEETNQILQWWLKKKRW